MLVFGHAGPPVFVFPTSMGSFFEYEDRGMIGALADKLEGGGLRLFCVQTVDGESFYAQRHPRERIDRYLPWERSLLDEMVPFAKHVTGHETFGVTGCSFGAYHAFTMALRHPDVFTSCIAMGGAFDITRFLDGYYDQDAYLLCPPHFLPGLDDQWFLDRYPAKQVGAGHRRSRHLPRRHRTGRRPARPPRPSRTASTSGATARITTGRSG